MKSIVSALAALLLSTAGSHAAHRNELQLIDLTDDYDRIWTEIQQLPEDQRVTHFKAAFAPLLPGFYDAARFARFGVTPSAYDASLAKMLRAYPQQRAGIARVSAEFRVRFRPARRSFEKAFGPMRGYPPIYLVNAHGEFDGGTRDLPEGTRLLFGADMIDRIHAGKPIQPFFHHELFHLFHARSFRECAQLWCGLWAEGLATYVASRLNPAADDDALLLTTPQPLRAAVESHRQEAACAVLSRFDSEDGEAYSAVFAGGSKPLSASLPPRFGYYVGLLVAQDLAKGRRLKQLAVLDNEQAKPLVRNALAAMCG